MQPSGRPMRAPLVWSSDGQSSKDVTDEILCARAEHHFVSIWRSMIRRTSSATEMSSRAASFRKNVNCGSVNEIICFVMASASTAFQCVQCAIAECAKFTLGNRFGLLCLAKDVLLRHDASPFTREQHGLRKVERVPSRAEQVNKGVVLVAAGGSLSCGLAETKSGGDHSWIDVWLVDFFVGGSLLRHLDTIPQVSPEVSNGLG
jgi:hypothetical protein